MKKDKDWLSEQVGELDSTDAVFNESGLPYIDTVVSIERVFDLIYQLDEPEVKQIKELESYNDELIRDNNQLRNALDELEVLSQELPVIPKYVADWIEDLKSKKINLLESIYDFTHGEDINNYMREQGNVLLRAWLDGYTVEEEQKYYVSERDEEYGGFWFLSKNNNGDISIGVNRDWSEVDWDRLKLTEQEIKDYDPRYWAFAVPVEELTND